MKERNISNVTFVMLAFHKRSTWMNILPWFMKETKLFKCNTCDSSFANKSNLKGQITTGHKGEKLFNFKIFTEEFVLA